MNIIKAILKILDLTAYNNFKKRINTFTNMRIYTNTKKNRNRNDKYVLRTLLSCLLLISTLYLFTSSKNIGSNARDNLIVTDQLQTRYERIINNNTSDLYSNGLITRSAEFTFSYNVERINEESILTLTIGTKNWVEVVNGIAAFNVKIAYDSDVFEYISTITTTASGIVDSDMFETTDLNKDVLAILYMDNNFTTPIQVEGEVCKSTFRINSNANPGDYTFVLYGDNVVVDGQLPKFNSIPAIYPSKLSYNIPLVYKIGDVDNNGLIQISDYAIGLEIITKRFKNPSLIKVKALDITQDGILSITDLLLLKHYLSGKIQSFPIKN